MTEGSNATQCELGYHFFEWLGAIILYEATGYVSLIEKYLSANHKRKQALWNRVRARGIRDIACENGWPDLFAFSPDHRDWLFCETKGTDKLGEGQIACMNAIHSVSGKRVLALRFTELR